MKIVVETKMDKMPANCRECTHNVECTLPLKRYNIPEIHKAYWEKRHKKCPLREIEE